NTMATFNSVTIHCARCHDHKFDPIPQRDYYRLQAVFAGVERGDRPFGERAAMQARAALERERRELAERLAALLRRAAAASSPELERRDRELEAMRRELAAVPRPAGAADSPSNGYHSAIASRPDEAKWVQVDLGRVVPVDAIVLVPARPTDFADTPGFGFPLRYRV